MKICIVSWMFDIEKHAGVGRVGAELLAGLRKRKYDIVTMSLNKTNHLDYLKYLMWDIPRNLPAADVYIAQSPMESIWLPKDKTICIVHDLIPLLHPHLAGANMNNNPIKTFLGSRFYWLGARSASHCKRIICNSSQTRNELKQYFNVPDSKLRVVDLGVRPDLDYKLKKDSIFRVGYLGQLDRRKRVNLLIQAFKASNIDGELVIGGTGPDRAKLEAQAAGDSRIKFLGFVPDSQLCDFYNSLSVFAFPSAAEGWGIPIVEAMACRKLVMVWRDSFIPIELKYKCFLDTDFNNLRSMIAPNIWGNNNSVNDNYQFAHSFSWDKFSDGVDKIVREVANG